MVKFFCYRVDVAEQRPDRQSEPRIQTFRGLLPLSQCRNEPMSDESRFVYIWLTQRSRVVDEAAEKEWLKKNRTSEETIANQWAEGRKKR